MEAFRFSARRGYRPTDEALGLGPAGRGFYQRFSSFYG